MNIYERIFDRLEELHMSQIELSRRTGIATSTISDWRKKKINPQADKLVTICKALDMSLVDLLCDEDDNKNKVLTSEYVTDDGLMIETIMNASDDIKRRVIAYYQLICDKDNSDKQDRSISIIQDENGKSIVLINDIRYKSRRSIDLSEIEIYLKQYIGEYYEILESSDKVFVGTDFPDEFAHSKDTKIIEIATDKAEFPDHNKKHGSKAKFGWYRYTTRFGIPVYNDEGILESYNIFRTRILVRRDADGKLYLYDVVTIKKETSRPLESQTVRW